MATPPKRGRGRPPLTEAEKKKREKRAQKAKEEAAAKREKEREKKKQQMLCNKLEKFDRHDWKAILDQSIYAGWQDIYALKQDDQYEQSTEMEFPRL